MTYLIKDDPTPVDGGSALDVLRAMRDRTPLDRDLGDHAWIDVLAERALAQDWTLDPPASADPAEARADHLLKELIRVGGLAVQEVAHA